MLAKREIVLDTETTGLDPGSGHRIVEIGCLELINHLPTGQSYQCYLNPERDMPQEAYRVHGLSTEFLAKHKLFADIVEELLNFLEDSPLIIHNAGFDLGFLNAELAYLERQPLDPGRAIDTVLIARQKFPGAQASLDALCRRFNIDNSARTKHGALLDAELLAEVYLELIGARQTSLALSAAEATQAGSERVSSLRETRAARPHAPSEEEIAAHTAFVDRLEDPIWRK
ncbi:MAG: DNA polymerase III subunit epsilon [Alphaproteobacteria bacterium]|nr:DNA polymerase III subunit epsilon [Alphaproteobacteria bacterium]